MNLLLEKHLMKKIPENHIMEISNSRSLAFPQQQAYSQLCRNLHIEVH